MAIPGMSKGGYEIAIWPESMCDGQRASLAFFL